MKIRILGCYGGQLPGKNLTSFLIGESLLVDAGGATAVLSLDELKKIETIVVSHSHLDHVKDIPLIADNVIGRIGRPIEIIGLKHTIDAVRDHLMGNVIWPDFSVIPSKEEPVIRYRREKAGKAFKVGKIEIEFVIVNHPVPCAGMMFRSGKKSFLYTADTGSTEDVWKFAKAEKNLKGLITEVSFPNSLEQLSIISGHMSPCHIDPELAKIGRTDLPVYIYHIKPGFEAKVREEIGAIRYRRLSILEQGQVLDI